jgi:hypothetical protein
MLLFIFLLILDTMAAIVIGDIIPGSMFDQFCCGLAAYFLLVTISLHFCILVSMRLGKIVKWTLKKSDIKPIAYYDNDIVKTLESEMHWTDIDEINYSETNSDVYLIINRYNIPEWCRLLIFEKEVDDIEYIVEMPIEGRNS